MRIVRVVFGHVTLDVRCDPRFDYARCGHTARAAEQGVEFGPRRRHAARAANC